MPPTQLEIIAPRLLAEHIQSGSLRKALDGMAAALNVVLCVVPQSTDDSRSEPPSGAANWPIRYDGRVLGSLFCRSGGDVIAAGGAATAILPVLEHVLDREIAVEDLADALVTGYDELNMLYSLLPSISTKVSEQEIGEVLVDEAARMLRCRRVSLLLLDEDSKVLRVAASRGLPSSVLNVRIPMEGTIAGHAMFEDDLLIVNHPGERPEAAAASPGRYETGAFVVARVPVRAQGQALGILAATERINSEEFTAHDRKLLEGLSAMGASALLNCRLHAAAKHQLMSTIRALASAVDAKDEYTHDHSTRVAELCVATAHELDIRDAQQLREIELAGMLHDIGKIGIPDAILRKNGRLTPEEFAVIRTHVQIGANIVDHVDGLKSVARAIRHHHERHDGLGYPDGVAGEEIPIGSRLIAVADTYDSLTSDRPYRKAAPAADARRIILREEGTQFDSDVVQAFLRLIDRQLDAPGTSPPASSEQRDLCTTAAP